MEFENEKKGIEVGQTLSFFLSLFLFSWLLCSSSGGLIKETSCLQGRHVDLGLVYPNTGGSVSFFTRQFEHTTRLHNAHEC
jgi:hypothetical protein